MNVQLTDTMCFSITVLAVFMAEVVKLVVCLFLVYLEEGSSMIRLKASLINAIIKNKTDTVRITHNTESFAVILALVQQIDILNRIISAQNDRTISNLR